MCIRDRPGTNELGGGAGGSNNAYLPAGSQVSGGSGIVIIRRLTADSNTTSGTVSTDGSDTIHKFTASGTYIG